MNTRKGFIRDGFGLAAILAAQSAPAILVRSMVAARGSFFGRGAGGGGGYVAGYTDLIEGWSPVGSGNQTILLDEGIVPLGDFTVDGCMTYKGLSTGDSAVLGLNNPNSGTFSLWFRDSNIVPRCFASENRSFPIAVDVVTYPTFCFSIRFNLSAQTMTFANGDLTTQSSFFASNWAWNMAYGNISSGLTSFGIGNERLSDINSIRVYPFVLTDADLVSNHATDVQRFGS